MRNDRWCELSVDRVCQEHEMMREVNANETSDKLGYAFSGTLLGVSQLRIPESDPLTVSYILLALVSILSTMKDDAR